MADIQAINFPFIGDATVLKVQVNAFPTDAPSTSLSWYLLTAEGKVCLNGEYFLTDTEFQAWGQDNSYLDDLVAASIPVTIIPPLVN
jgi:hypothetical protein